MQISKDFLKSGEMNEVDVNGKSVLVANVDGKYYAIGNVCPHMRCKLHRGTLAGNIVECPCHGSRFDVTDGKLIGWLRLF